MRKAVLYLVMVLMVSFAVSAATIGVQCTPGTVNAGDTVTCTASFSAAESLGAVEGVINLPATLGTNVQVKGLNNLLGQYNPATNKFAVLAFQPTSVTNFLEITFTAASTTGSLQLTGLVANDDKRAAITLTSAAVTSNQVTVGAGSQPPTPPQAGSGLYPPINLDCSSANPNLPPNTVEVGDLLECRLEFDPLQFQQNPVPFNQIDGFLQIDPAAFVFDRYESPQMLPPGQFLGTHASGVFNIQNGAPGAGPVVPELGTIYLIATAPYAGNIILVQPIVTDLNNVQHPGFDAVSPITVIPPVGPAQAPPQHALTGKIRNVALEVYAVLTDKVCYAENAGAGAVFDETNVAQLKGTGYVPETGEYCNAGNTVQKISKIAGALRAYFQNP